MPSRMALTDYTTPTSVSFRYSPLMSGMTCSAGLRCDGPECRDDETRRGSRKPNVSYWHEASDPSLIPDRRFRSEADIADRPASISAVADDPGCVKTHTAAKCRKNNSPGGHHVSRVQ